MGTRRERVERGSHAIRDWPALLGADHPLAQPGALSLSRRDDGVEEWSATQPNSTPEEFRWRLLLTRVDTGGGQWAASCGSLMVATPWADVSLSGLGMLIRVTYRSLSDVADTCSGRSTE